MGNVGDVPGTGVVTTAKPRECMRCNHFRKHGTKGVDIPEGPGKCRRPGGLCDDHVYSIPAEHGGSGGIPFEAPTPPGDPGQPGPVTQAPEAPEVPTVENDRPALPGVPLENLPRVDVAACAKTVQLRFEEMARRVQKALLGAANDIPPGEPQDVESLLLHARDVFIGESMELEKHVATFDMAIMQANRAARPTWPSGKGGPSASVP